jgi:hypothetical protein
MDFTLARRASLSDLIKYPIGFPFFYCVVLLRVALIEHNVHTGKPSSRNSSDFFPTFIPVPVRMRNATETALLRAGGEIKHFRA